MYEVQSGHPNATILIFPWSSCFNQPNPIQSLRTLGQVLDYNMALTGNGAEVAIYTDGEELPADRRTSAAPSVVGNQLSGTFKLALRGWETEV